MVATTVFPGRTISSGSKLEGEGNARLGSPVRHVWIHFPSRVIRDPHSSSASPGHPLAAAEPPSPASQLVPRRGAAMAV